MPNYIAVTNVLSIWQILLLSAVVVSAKEKRGTEYYNNQQRPYSFAHFSQELPASEGLLRLLPTYQKATPQPLAIVPVYIEQPISIPIQQLPLVSKVPLVYQYQGESKPNTFPHLKPYYKQVDQGGNLLSSYQ